MALCTRLLAKVSRAVDLINLTISNESEFGRDEDVIAFLNTFKPFGQVRFTDAIEAT